MLKFKSGDQIVFSESDNGDIEVADKKLAEALKADGIKIRESKEEGEK